MGLPLLGGPRLPLHRLVRLRPDPLRLLDDELLRRRLGLGLRRRLRLRRFILPRRTELPGDLLLGERLRLLGDRLLTGGDDPLRLTGAGGGLELARLIRELGGLLLPGVGVGDLLHFFGLALLPSCALSGFFAGC